MHNNDIYGYLWYFVKFSHLNICLTIHIHSFAGETKKTSGKIKNILHVTIFYVNGIA